MRDFITMGQTSGIRFLNSYVCVIEKLWNISLKLCIKLLCYECGLVLNIYFLILSQLLGNWNKIVISWKYYLLEYVSVMSVHH